MRTKYKEHNFNHHTPTDITLTYIYVYIPGDWRLTSNQILLSKPDPPTTSWSAGYNPANMVTLNYHCAHPCILVTWLTDPLR